ncbi:MAG TPA: Stk1 family PASTA domain-containing Ser/Thr kinase [Actinophytocola sp.]|nr:Stk1 family PASTA domain-containing Ser/Thr kinase [Actinophytocola sp.]
MTSPRLLSNRYELGEVLGYGGMSEVHKGRDVRLGRDVAVKVLRADLARDPQFQERFRREAQNAAALNHPAIVAVYDTGETRTEHGPLPYIVMEYVDGRTLRDIVKTEGPLPGQRAMEVMADVCAALDFSHRHGIVHRDVKPANVMITKTGAVKVMDFGIARAVADGQAAVTQTAAVIGTAQYLSPEQARGEAVDARSDVYAAGCVLFELLTGDPPFTGDSPVAVAYQHVREDPKPPSSLNSRVSPALDAIVLKAMSKGAPNRYQSSAEMRTDLVRVLSGQRPLAPMVMTDEDRTAVMSQGRAPMEATRGRHRPQTLAKDYDDYDPYEDEEEERRRRRKKGWLIALVAVLAIALIGVVVWLVSSAFNTTPPSNEVTVPNVVGENANDAQRQLREQGFDVQVESVPCQPTPDGRPGPCGPNAIGNVIETDPPAGEKMDKSDRLLLRVGAPAEKVDVPDLTGKTPEEAERILAEKGLTVDPNQATKETPDENLVGKVIDQSPGAGQPVDKGSQVTLTIGEEQETVSVPNLTGQDVETARANLENFGFEVQVEEVSSEEPAGTVVGQDPSSGEHPPGTTVTLQVSNGDQAEEKIVMPSLLGLRPDQAEAQLRQLGWEGELNVQEGGQVENSDDFMKIVEQEVAEGQEIDIDQEIGVRIATEIIGGGGG